MDVHNDSTRFSFPLSQEVSESQVTRKRSRAPSCTSFMSSLSLQSTPESRQLLSLSYATPALDKRSAASGSFALTRSATDSLQSFYRPSTKSFSRRARIPFSWTNGTTEVKRPSLLRKSSGSSSYTEYDVDGPETPDLTVPSISRTFAEPYEPNTPASSSTSTLYSTHDHPHVIPKVLPTSAHPDMNPILASLERKSKLCTRQMHCATCSKPGRDFPKCPRCGDGWCSRPCRLVDGKRHVCRPV